MPKGIKGFIKGHKHGEETKRKIGLANSDNFMCSCDSCRVMFKTRKSHFNRKKRRFCSMGCYIQFVKTLSFEEQNAYKGIRKPNESKQVYHRNYCKNHPDIISHLKARRYAREKGATGSHTLKQWSDLKESYGNVCAYCGKQKKLTKDHIVPLSKGGTDFIENIQPLCRNCNSKKHNKIIYENPELLKGN